MRARISALAALAPILLLASLGAPAAAKTRSGVKGALLNTTCPGPCTPTPCACPPSPCPPCTAKICPERPRPQSPALIACPAARALDSTAVQPQPYSGPDAHLVVRRTADHKVVARRQPTDGHFRVRLAPGAYQVHGYVAAACWHGETKRVVVQARDFTTLQLDVYNACVVSPQPARKR